VLKPLLSSLFNRRARPEQPMRVLTPEEIFELQICIGLADDDDADFGDSPQSFQSDHWMNPPRLYAMSTPQGWGGAVTGLAGGQSYASGVRDWTRPKSGGQQNWPLSIVVIVILVPVLAILIVWSSVAGSTGDSSPVIPTAQPPSQPSPQVQSDVPPMTGPSGQQMAPALQIAPPLAATGQPTAVGSAVAAALLEPTPTATVATAPTVWATVSPADMSSGEGSTRLMVDAPPSYLHTGPRPTSNASRQEPPTPTSTPAPTATPMPTLITGNVVVPTVEAWEMTAFLPLQEGSGILHNVVTVLNANGGALRSVELSPGERWSFNQTVGNPDLLDYVYVGNVYGGGVCDLASRYVVALRPLLSPGSFSFTRHRDATGEDLIGVSPNDAVSIWSVNGGPKERDLVITNTSGRTIVISTLLTERGVTVRVRRS